MVRPGHEPPAGWKKRFQYAAGEIQRVIGHGKNCRCRVLMQEAIKSPDATVQLIHQYGRGLLIAGQKEKALEVFKYNAQKNLATDKFTPNVGLARGYTAMGDTKKAITYWEEAIKNIPENQKANIKFYQGELDKLKSGK